MTAIVKKYSAFSFLRQTIPRIYFKKIRRITRTQSVKSTKIETHNFLTTTSIGGASHLVRSKGKYRKLWISIFLLSTVMFLVQVFYLLVMYFDKPTMSKISFTIAENGLTFPAVTICDSNPIRRSYIEKLNATGQFSRELLDYLTMGMLEVQDLLDLAGFNDLIHGEAQLERYNVVTNSTLNINRFINDSGYECQDLLKICSVNGKIFDCCKAARPLLNSNGRCYEIDIHSSNITWLQKPVRQGLNNGLLVIAEYHQEESLSLTNDIAKEALFGDVFQNGFKYSIHESKKSAIFSSEDVSISPGTRVFSAVSAEYYSLLSYDDWGNCTRNWPEKLSYLQSTKPYSASDCKALCRANYFVEKCECSPFSYNVEGRYKVCTPYQLYDCLSKDYKDLNIDIHDIMPACKDCRVDCETWQYSSSNSFGGEFPTKALSYITQHNSSWSPELISQNFIAVNVFFKENSYRVYEQIKGTTISECLSNIGGCLGLFLGLSIISLGEMFVYFTKIFWVFLSKRRRNIVIEKERSQSMNV